MGSRNAIALSGCKSQGSRGGRTLRRILRERDDLVFANSAIQPLSLLLAPEGRVNSDRCAYFREAETVSARRPDEPAEIEVLGRRPLRDRGRKPRRPPVANHDSLSPDSRISMNRSFILAM